MKLRSSKTKLFYETSFKTEASKLKNPSFSAKLPSKMKLRSSKTKLFCEKSFKNEAVETQKRSFSARLPSKKLWSSKTKLFYETSFKTEASKLKNPAFLRDFLQKWSFEALKRSFSARNPSKMKLRNSKTKLFCETSFKNDTSGTNRVTGDHKGDAPFLCDRCGTPSTLGHLWPYLFYFKT